MPPSQKRFSHNILKTVVRTINDYRMFQSGDSVLVGVSGGPDSVALLHILHGLAPRFSLKLGVAHLDHCIRQKASGRDAKFVMSLAANLNLNCFVHKEDVREYQRRHKLSLEEAARRVRYRFFRQISENNTYNKIALGHHRDDNTELILMYLFRGSGPLGLSGIPPVRGNIVRPLINLPRDDIVAFLTKQNLQYVLDESNRDTRFLRNKIRHHLLPVLRASYNPSISRTLTQTALILRNEDEWIQNAIAPVYKKSLVVLKKNRIVLSVPKLEGLHVAVLRRITRKALADIKGNLRRITFKHVDSAVQLIQNGPSSGQLDFPDRIRIKRENEFIVFSREKEKLRSLNTEPETTEGNSREHYQYIIEKPGTFIVKEIGKKIRFSETPLTKPIDFSLFGQTVAFFDRDCICYPLTLRNFKPGDRFTPLGMEGTQKVKKFFIENKISRTKRTQCPLLVSKGRIIWVAGHRIDNSVKVGPSTRQILKAELLLA